MLKMCVFNGFLKWAGQEILQTHMPLVEAYINQAPLYKLFHIRIINFHGGFSYCSRYHVMHIS